MADWRGEHLLGIAMDFFWGGWNETRVSVFLILGETASFSSCRDKENMA